jgi:CubicO group peptidase (beta-lactamase class C family)
MQPVLLRLRVRRGCGTWPQAAGVRWRSAILAVLLAMSVHASAQPTRPDALASDMGMLLRQQGLTGVVWALVDPVNGVRTGAAGLKDAATGEAMQAAHRVHIGSITKTVLALGVLRLVRQGHRHHPRQQLSLWDKIASQLDK